MRTPLALRESQIPKPDTKVFLYAGGRGSGKTRAGAMWSVTAPGNVLVIGRNASDIRETMMEGESGVYESYGKGLGTGRTPGTYWGEDSFLIATASIARFPHSLHALTYEIKENGIQKVWVDEAQNLKLDDWLLLNEMFPDAKFFLGFTPTVDANELLTYLYRRALAMPYVYELTAHSTLGNALALQENYIESIVSIYGETEMASSQLRGIYSLEHYA